jgi:predicted nucleic acid-binding protein
VILVDTSVWVDHLRNGDPCLVALLEQGAVLMHPAVIGEIACGHLRGRRQVLALLEGLPSATQASHREVLVLIEGHPLAGRGLGHLDAHLLAAARLSGSWLWTLDRRLAALVAELGVAWDQRLA